MEAEIDMPGKKKPKPRTIKLVHQDYQPSKAELEEDLRLKGTFKQTIKALVRPVQIRRVKSKRKH